MSLSQLPLYLRFAYDLGISTVQLFGGRAFGPVIVKDVDMTGKIAIITGANSGIGLSIATSLARQGATVFLACRSLQRGQDAAQQIIDQYPDSSKRVHVVQLDTSDLESVRTFAALWKKGASQDKSIKIDVLIHNAGIAGAPEGQAITKDGLGLVYSTNFAGSFLLTSLLESSLSDTVRVIFTSSYGQYGGKPFELFDNPGYLPRANINAVDSGFYAGTKAMQVIFSKLLQQRWNRNPSNQRISHAFTPGYTYTPIFDKMRTLPPSFDPIFWALKAGTMLSTPVDVGAATGVWLATTEERAVTDPRNGGKYWDRCVHRLAGADMLELTHGPESFRTLWNIWCKDSGAQWE